jgi:acetyl-CoA C-acetyltransferase
MPDAVIVSAVRTPIGSFLGGLSSIEATDLGAVVVKEAVKRAAVQPTDVDEVIMGNVLAAGLGQAPARQATIKAGLPYKTHSMTINKVCGSGLKTVMLAADAVTLGHAEVIVAGGMESMSGAPYLLKQGRTGYRMGDGTIIDAMIKDGLWDAYNDFHMGVAAERTAEKYGVSREEQDEFASESYRRALQAQEKGWFKDEIVAVDVPQRKGTSLAVSEDEEPKRVKFDKISSLRAAFKKDGTVTAANASSISDGAAAVVVMSSERARSEGITPIARIVAYASASMEPEWFTIAPPEAMKKVLDKTGLAVKDIDLFEVNEAFAVVALLAHRMMELDPQKVNIHGGAVALGHPIGASGARVLATLLYAMRKVDAHRGLATLCIGGGEAVAMIVERP